MRVLIIAIWLFSFLWWFFNCDIGLAQIEAIVNPGTIPLPPDEMPWYGMGLQQLLNAMPDINAWFGALMIGLMGILRGTSELLGFIATKTETKKDDRIAREIHHASLWAAKFVGWFGLGTPRVNKK